MVYGDMVTLLKESGRGTVEKVVSVDERFCKSFTHESCRFCAAWRTLRITMCHGHELNWGA